MTMFTPLPSTTEGIGPYRMNRYRIYFRPLNSEQRRSGHIHNQSPEQIARDLAHEFKGNFPRFFNPNLATVSSREEQWNGRNTLRFVLTAQLFGVDHPVADYLAPDCHADWVGIHHAHERGFTVQTLRRNFFTGLDAYLATVTTGGATAAGAGAGSLFGGVGAGPGAAMGFGGGLIASGVGMYINRSHFLAGRRSWIFASKQEWGRHGVDDYDAIPDDAVAFETAAVERLSGWIFKVADATRILGSFDRSVHRVWVRLMNNYLAAKDFEALPVRVWPHQDGRVSYVEPEPCSTLRSVESNTEYADLSRRHLQMIPS